MSFDKSSIDCLLLYQDILTQMSVIYTNYNAEHILIAGDMNTDVSRFNSKHTQLLTKFVSKEKNKLWVISSKI